MREKVYRMSGNVTPALLLAAVLAGGARPAAGQAGAGMGAALPPTLVDGDAIPPADGGRSDSERRRDPFASPLRRSDAPAAGERPRGLAGIGVDELTLHGLVRIGGDYVAVLESGNGRSHLLRGGETLFDGAVRSVTAAGVVIVRRGRAGRPGPDARTVRLTLSAAGAGKP